MFHPARIANNKSDICLTLGHLNGTNLRWHTWQTRPSPFLPSPPLSSLLPPSLFLLLLIIKIKRTESGSVEVDDEYLKCNSVLILPWLLINRWMQLEEWKFQNVPAGCNYSSAMRSLRMLNHSIRFIDRYLFQRDLIESELTNKRLINYNQIIN